MKRKATNKEKEHFIALERKQHRHVFFTYKIIELLIISF